MAGLIARLFGGQSGPPAPPGQGEGGYTLPRGPYGATGMPGSTAAAPPTHDQGPGGTRVLDQTATENQRAWALQPRRCPSGEPQQPRAQDLDQAHDTERFGTVVLSQDTPGAENVRNTRAQRYKGRPGDYQQPVNVIPSKSPRGDRSGTNRYYFDGVEMRDFDRRIPYDRHARPAGYHGAPNNRGADLSGERYYTKGGSGKGQFGNAGSGSFGVARSRGPNHRPTTFAQPAPWSSNFYDTSAAEQQGTTRQAPDIVYVSPSPARSSVTGRRRRG